MGWIQTSELIVLENILQPTDETKSRKFQPMARIVGLDGVWSWEVLGPNRCCSHNGNTTDRATAQATCEAKLVDVDDPNHHERWRLEAEAATAAALKAAQVEPRTRTSRTTPAKE